VAGGAHPKGNRRRVRFQLLHLCAPRQNVGHPHVGAVQERDAFVHAGTMAPHLDAVCQGHEDDFYARATSTGDDAALPRGEDEEKAARFRVDDTVEIHRQRLYGRNKEVLRRGDGGGKGPTRVAAVFAEQVQGRAGGFAVGPMK